MPELVRVLDLNATEKVGLTSALDHIPLPRHPVAIADVDPAIPTLIERLCCDEARRWGYPIPTNGPIENDDTEFKRDFQSFAQQLRWLLKRHGVRDSVIDEVTARTRDAARSPADPPADETPIPVPGHLLGARLALNGSLSLTGQECLE